MLCTTDLESSKTEDFSEIHDPNNIVILQTAHFLKPGVPSSCKEDEETKLFEVI